MTRGPLLVAGAINTDLVAVMQRAPAAGETITAEAFHTYGGGKGANQAVSAARNEATVVMLGAFGDDANGIGRRADLEAAGISTEWIRINPDHPSGVALIFVETDGENRIAYVPGVTLHVQADHCLVCLEETRPSLVLATNELPTVALTALFAAASRANATVVFNATPDTSRATPMLRAVDILIVNEGEAKTLLGINDDRPIDVAAARRLLEAGPSVAVITLGSRGAIAVTADQEIAVPAPAVEVVDTTGAGDAFCGAFAASIERGEDLSTALRYGVYSGSLATTIPGAQTSSPTRQAIEQLLGEAAIEAN
jgi:ribokinase